MLWTRRPPWLLEIVVAQCVGEVIENTVREPRFFAGEEGMGNRGVLAERYSRRHIAAVHQLVSAGAEDRAKDRIEALQRPILGERRRDFGVEAVPVIRHAADDVGKQFGIGISQPIAFDLLAETVPDEFAHDRARIGLAICLKLVECLDRRQPSHAAPAAAGALTVVPFRSGGHPALPAKRRFKSTIARQARTASPPLSRPSGEARASAWASFSTVRMPYPMAIPSRTAKSWSPRALSAHMWS